MLSKLYHFYFLSFIKNYYYINCYNSSIEKKLPIINQPEKRRESLPEILQNSQNISNASEKSKTEFNIEDKTRYSLLANSSQMNNLNLKTTSAESLRSISPGSDSVFYSDPCNRVSSSSRCTRCNNEVDIDYTNDTNGQIIDIVKPPKGFGDSPEEPPTTPIRRSTKRFRSEERRRTGRSEQTRAKSEERVKNYREKGR